MAKPRVYLASPYSHHDPATRDLRALRAAHAALDLMSRGEALVYSPIAAWHPWCTNQGTPFSFEYWREEDEDMLMRCDELWVLMLEGWRKSKGVAEEILVALREQMPIRYVTPDKLEVFDQPPLAA